MSHAAIVALDSVAWRNMILCDDHPFVLVRPAIQPTTWARPSSNPLMAASEVARNSSDVTLFTFPV